MNYDAADKAIKAINRENVKLFGRLKIRLMKADELNIIRAVGEAYDTSIRMAERRLLECARLAYEAAMRESGKKKRNPIDRDWLIEFLMTADPVTLYKFLPEAERKKARLTEALAATTARAAEVDKSLKAWTRQIGQAAIGVTDAATIRAFKDAGVTHLVWHSEHDDRVCKVCHARDGNVYPINELPLKHPNCRCWYSIATDDFRRGTA